MSKHIGVVFAHERGPMSPVVARFDTWVISMCRRLGFDRALGSTAHPFVLVGRSNEESRKCSGIARR
jgi:hypothetical protein